MSFGKDEVPSSNLGISSNKNRLNLRVLAVFLMFCELSRGICFVEKDLVDGKSGVFQLFRQLFGLSEGSKVLGRKGFKVFGPPTFRQLHE